MRTDLVKADPVEVEWDAAARGVVVEIQPDVLNIAILTNEFRSWHTDELLVTFQLEAEFRWAVLVGP